MYFLLFDTLILICVNVQIYSYNVLNRFILFDIVVTEIKLNVKILHSRCLIVYSRLYGRVSNIAENYSSENNFIKKYIDENLKFTTKLKLLTILILCLLLNQNACQDHDLIC